MADLNKPMGQLVKQKSSDKFNRLNGLFFYLIGFTILVGEGDLSIFERYQAMVGYGHPMGIACDIFKHGLTVFNRLFGVDDLSFQIETIDEVFKALLCFERRAFAGKV